MLYTSPARHGSPGATWRHSRHSHIQSSTPSTLARSPLGSTTPLSAALACVSHTPRSVPCPPESAPSDGSSLASSVLQVTAASSCAINSPTSASLPGAACAAPSPPAASRRYASKACETSLLMSRGLASAASYVACAACTSAVSPPMVRASCTPCAGGGPPGTGMGPPGTTGGAPRGMAGSGAEVAYGGGRVAVDPARGTARGGSVICAPGAPTGAVRPAALWVTRCASPYASPGCSTPSPGAGADGGADVACAPRAAVGSPTCAVGGTGTACCGG